MLNPGSEGPVSVTAPSPRLSIGEPPLVTRPQPAEPEDEQPDKVALSRQRLARASLNAPSSLLRDLQETNRDAGEQTIALLSEIGEAGVVELVSKYFTHCHPIAPFLCPTFNRNLLRLQSNKLLFLVILSVGARFWSLEQPGAASWLHSSYGALISEIDQELFRITFRPNLRDSSLETVQALLILVHWPPLDGPTTDTLESRYNDLYAWNLLGLTLRYAISAGVEDSVIALRQSGSNASETDVRRFRTWIYLLESDVHLAVTARQRAMLNPESAMAVADEFLLHPQSYPSDRRLVSLLKVSGAARLAAASCGDLSFRHLALQAVQQFNETALQIETQYLEPMNGSGTLQQDTMSRHFPFIAITWYRLSLSCAVLSPTHTEAPEELLSLSLSFSRQILSHLAEAGKADQTIAWSDVPLTPDPTVVKTLSCSIEQHYVVLAYAASFLVVTWFAGSVTLAAEPLTATGEAIPPTSSSPTLYPPLYRLVRLAADTLSTCGPRHGHPSAKYARILYSLANVVLDGKRGEVCALPDAAYPVHAPGLDRSRSPSGLLPPPFPIPPLVPNPTEADPAAVAPNDETSWLNGSGFLGEFGGDVEFSGVGGLAPPPPEGPVRELWEAAGLYAPQEGTSMDWGFLDSLWTRGA
ncbi:hypothetical protein JCM8547_000151 [Rhodosporidiobolus lusitaniae]